MLTACFSVMVQLLLLLIRIAIKLRLSIPLMYLALMLTAFRPWYRAHTAFADGIFLALVGCTVYLSTLPDPSPFASFSTSETVTRLKSPKIECFRQEAATANSNACLLSW